ncbi:MAG: NAD(P)-binding domain-containing protein [Muribaculaceae bacterium]|nr:NAD(P)-binding domain-containing protein [Muribaculaceae bacterium]
MNNSSQQKPTILIVGAGNIGTAMARGIARSRHHVIVYNRSSHRLDQFADDSDFTTVCDLRDAVRTYRPSVTVICVEGDAVRPVIDEMGPELGKCRPVTVSCAAAASLADLEGWLRPYLKKPGVVRLLPTIAATEGVSANLVCSSGVGNEELEVLRKLFAATGSWYEIPEKDFGAAMALTSCGIAFALRYIRACSEAGVELGLAPAQAAAMTASALEGAAAMLRATGLHPEVLVDRVTTPGGLTIRGLNAMEANGFSAAVNSGIKAAANKCHE